MKSKKELRELFKKNYIEKNNLGGVSYPNEKAVVSLWYLTKNKEFANDYVRNYVVLNYLEKYKTTDFANIILFYRFTSQASHFALPHTRQRNGHTTVKIAFVCTNVRFFLYLQNFNPQT